MPSRVRTRLVATLAAAAASAASATPGAEAAVAVYPTAGTPAASPRTQISFRGATAAELGAVVVSGSRSGRHPGRLAPHSDGRGASFLPARRFRWGERVTVRAGAELVGARRGAVSFGVERRGTVYQGPRQPASRARRGVQRFRTRPDLQPSAVRVLTRTPAASPDQLFVAPKGGTAQSGPMVLDARGRVQWFKRLPGNVQAYDFRPQVLDGRPVLTWFEGVIVGFHGVGEFVIADGGYREVARVRAGNGYRADLHEFELTPRGTALINIYHPVPWSLASVGGSRRGYVQDNIVQEIDLKTGLVLFEWHSLGQVGLRESVFPVATARGTAYDPFHINSTQEQPDGDLLVSARHTGAVYRIDRVTGRVEWRLGGKRSSFRLGRGMRFAWQHDARRLADGTFSLFDNVDGSSASKRRSRALVFRLDEPRRRATAVRALRHPAGLTSPTQGNAQVRTGGSVVVGWGGQNTRFSEFGPDGRIAFDAAFLAPGSESYRAYRGTWAGRPPGAPRAVASTAGGRTTISMSWNGATEIATWRVLAGPRADQLQPVGTVAWNGLETAARSANPLTVVAVQALDARGAVLGTSAAVSATGRR